MLFRRFLLSLVFTAALTASLSGADVAVDFQRDLAAWKADRLDRLTAPDSWLSLIGLHWLQPGDNSVGRAEDNTIRLPAGPAYLGGVHLAADGKVTFIAAPGSLAASDGVPVAGSKHGAVELAYRGGGKPTLVAARNVSFVVIQRGEKVGLRVRDSESDRRRNFAGLDYFDADPAWRIEAQWVPFDEPRTIPITNSLGQTTPTPARGKAVFTRDGRTFELVPIDGGDGTLFFIISDGTSGVETYEASRFLYAATPQDGKVVLDFNRAQNPPCAFTPFATCPLPPKENRLPIRVTAGEKAYRGDAH